MDIRFTPTNFVIKRKGISTGKFNIVSPQKESLFYVEVKIQWKAPIMIVRFYSDEKKQQELLLAQDGKHEDYSNFMDVIDSASGQKIGGIGGGSDFFKDSWAIMDAENKLVCKLGDTSTKRAILHELAENFVSQKMDFKAGEDKVGELRQKRALIGSQLLVDFSMDTANRLDRRLGLTAAILLASHQAINEDD